MVKFTFTSGPNKGSTVGSSKKSKKKSKRVKQQRTREEAAAPPSDRGVDDFSFKLAPNQGQSKPNEPIRLGKKGPIRLGTPSTPSTPSEPKGLTNNQIAIQTLKKFVGFKSDKVQSNVVDPVTFDLFTGGLGSKAKAGAKAVKSTGVLDDLFKQLGLKVDDAAIAGSKSFKAGGKVTKGQSAAGSAISKFDDPVVAKASKTKAEKQLNDLVSGKFSIKGDAGKALTGREFVLPKGSELPFRTEELSRARKIIKNFNITDSKALIRNPYVLLGVGTTVGGLSTLSGLGGAMSYLSLDNIIGGTEFYTEGVIKDVQQGRISVEDALASIEQQRLLSIEGQRFAKGQAKFNPLVRAFKSVVDNKIAQNDIILEDAIRQIQQGEDTKFLDDNAKLAARKLEADIAEGERITAGQDRSRQLEEEASIRKSERIEQGQIDQIERELALAIEKNELFQQNTQGQTKEQKSALSFGLLKSVLSVLLTTGSQDS
jgi:hypothetical protein